MKVARPITCHGIPKIGSLKPSAYRSLEAISKFEYHSAAPALCGPILEGITGMPVQEFAKDYLFDPLQISDYLWHTMSDGSTLTAGGMFMRPRDMAKIGYLILNRGQWHGQQILSEKWIDISTRPYTSDEEMGYGYYWWLFKYTGGDETYETIFAAGHGGQRIMVVPELEKSQGGRFG